MYENGSPSRELAFDVFLVSAPGLPPDGVVTGVLRVVAAVSALEEVEDSPDCCLDISSTAACLVLSSSRGCNLGLFVGGSLGFSPPTSTGSCGPRKNDETE